jgi:protein ImuB
LLRLVRAPERYEEAFDFEQALDTAQPLLFLLRRFVDQLSARLGAAGLAAAELRLVLPLDDGTRYERLFQIPSPTANADVLFRVLDTLFENLRLEQAPVGVRLAVEPARPEHQQFRLFENALRDPNRFAETLARISAVVGSGNVGVPELKSTHKPDQFTLTMPDFGTRPMSQQASASRAGSPAAVGLPLRRFRPPLAAQVHAMAAGGRRPEYVVSEQAHGRVVDALGPYRISGEWWETVWSAEEWDVQMESGGLYRLSRQGEAWTVEGCYDV